jgi:hypothetical protein
MASLPREGFVGMMAADYGIDDNKWVKRLRVHCRSTMPWAIPDTYGTTTGRTRFNAEAKRRGGGRGVTLVEVRADDGTDRDGFWDERLLTVVG